MNPSNLIVRSVQRDNTRVKCCIFGSSNSVYFCLKKLTQSVSPLISCVRFHNIYYMHYENREKI